MSSAPVTLDLVISENGFAVESAKPILEPFTALLAQAEDWRQRVALIKVTDVSQKREMTLARESRLALKDLRVLADKTRKRLKDESLRRSRMIDGAYNILEGIVAPLEAALLEQEQFAVRREEQRKAALKASREELLRPYGADTSFYDLGAMEDNVFKDLLDGTRLAAEKKAEDAKRAEADRIAREKEERERQDRLAQENARLKAEKDALEAKAKADRNAADKERREAEENAAQERRAVDEKIRAERAGADRKAKEAKDAADERDRVAQAAIDKANREAAAARAESARKIQAIHDAEEAKRKAEAEAARKAALAPDKEKLTTFAASIRAFQVPEMLSAEGVAAQIDLLTRLEEVADYADTLARKF